MPSLTVLSIAGLCILLMGMQPAAAQPFPSAGSPNPAMTEGPTRRAIPAAPVQRPGPMSRNGNQAAPPLHNAPLPSGTAPRAVSVARTTTIPACTVFVDGAGSSAGNGSARMPHKTIAAAVAIAGGGAVICVAEGVYAEQLEPGEKPFTLAGGFQRGKDFRVRDSATYATKAVGAGGSFIRIQETGPKKTELTVIDGFDISGYSQAIVRDYYESQRFDITNNHIHDNHCDKLELFGAGFALNNVTGRIEGNVFRNNSCGWSGAGFVQDGTQENTVTVARNLFDSNHGKEPGGAHGGALFLGSKTLHITGNLFTRNTVTQWGAGLYISAWTDGGKFTTANLNWNVYRDNRAGNAGGGMFCDNGATCISRHEIYDGNCGGNIYLDGGSDPNGPNTARFYHLTNFGALAVGCGGPGEGVRIDRVGGEPAADTYSFIDAIFWGNASGLDFAASCDRECHKVRITVSHSMVQTTYLSQGLTVTFGDGIMTPVDPLFADALKGDFHLKSAAGRWTPSGYTQDAMTSPAIGKGFPGGASDQNPPRAGARNELGAYGNSSEASLTR